MRRRRKERGYTLVALMIGITVMTVLIASVLPLASAETQRDREEELIFRGRQYAEGIRTFRRRYGRYPTSLREMLDTRPRTLRKLWKDPMMKSEVWGLINFGVGVPLIPGARGGAGAGKGTGPSPSPVPSPSPTPSSFFGGSGKNPGGPPGSPNGQPVGPVSGVFSLSTKKGYRLWEGREVYRDWRFTEASLVPAAGSNDTPGGLPGPGIGGGPGGGTGVGPKK